MSVAGRRYGAVEIGRLVAAILVVHIHTGPLHLAWPAANAVVSHGIARLAVPFFFVATGYFAAHALATAPRPWARRIGTMYLAWSLLYAPLWLVKLPDVGTALGRALLGFHHLWYLPALLAGGLMLGFAARLGPRRLFALALGCSLLGLALQYRMNLHWDWDALNPQDLRAQIPRNFLTVGFPFLALGYLMRTTDAVDRMFARPTWLRAAVVVAVLAFCAEFALGQHLFDDNRMSDQYLALFVLVPLIFAGLLRLPMDAPVWPLGKIATAIYFTHVYLIAIANTLFGLGPAGIFLFAVVAGAASAPLRMRVRRRVPAL